MRVHVFSLVVSFCVGIVLILCLEPKPSIVVKFPRPDTDDHEYTSQDGSCFKVKSQRVECSANAPVIPQPVQEQTVTETGLQFRWPFKKTDGSPAQAVEAP